jgi:pyruvate dehydrogenase E1 component alpha subunit
MAAVYRAPLVVVVENNQYAYSTPLEQQMAVTDIADRARGYGMPGIVVDGNDVEAVYVVVRDAVGRARSGRGPTLVEAKTMRMLGHAIHDGAEYVPAELLAEWEERDPLVRYEAVLRADGVDAGVLREIDARAAAEIDAAVAAAEASPLPDPSTVADGVYAE